MDRQDRSSIGTGPDPRPAQETADRERLLHALAEARDEPLTMAELRERGIQMPGQALYELELDGYEVERVHRRSPTHGRGVLAYRLRVPDR